MRSSITLYEDQYQFYKELKSKRLLVAFVEYMFEDIEPTGLNKLEKVVRNSLKIRMENQKKKSYAGSQSHGGGRKKIESNNSSELDSKNNTTNNTKTTEQTTKKQEVEVEEEVIKENKKRKFLEFVFLTDEEYNKLVEGYGRGVVEDQIKNLNNYIGQNGKDKYKSHYYTILNRMRKAGIKELPKKLNENESGIYDLPF